MSDAQPPTADASLSPLQLADGLLENVNKCPDCGKPVLQSAMVEHQGETTVLARRSFSRALLARTRRRSSTWQDWSDDATVPTATCQAIREGRVPDGGNLKRRLSEGALSPGLRPMHTRPTR